MRTVNFAATRYGYCCQVIDRGQIVYEYFAGNCQQESQTVIDPGSPNAVSLPQLRRWASKRRERSPRNGGLHGSNTMPTWRPR